MRAEGLGRRLRLRKRREFLRIQRGGTKLHTRHFLVFVRTFENSTEPRLGIAVTRKVGNAVRRNRIKRWVREAFRRARADGGFAGHPHMVWVAKQSSADLSYTHTCEAMASVAKQLRSAQSRRSTR